MLNKRSISIGSILTMTILFVLATASGAQAANVETMVKKCSHCHGKAGASTESDVPIIGGYSVEFLVNNIKAYRDHERDCPDTKFKEGPDKGQTTSMCKIAKEFQDSEIRQIAVYFSKQKFVRAKQKFDAALAEKGKEVHEVYCEKCHAEGGSQAKDDAGMMAGQWMPYLRQAFDEFNTGKRPIPKKMKRKLEEITPEDLEVLVNYYASFH
jgi:sulfide dehydrogenase cytochrome subunit